MKRILAVALALAATLTPAAPVHAATPVIQRPTLVTVSPGRYKVVATVEAPAGAVVTLGRDAYRHAYREEAAVISPGGPVEIVALCDGILLPHTWRVFIDGAQVVYASGIRCR